MPILLNKYDSRLLLFLLINFDDYFHANVVFFIHNCKIIGSNNLITIKEKDVR
jgi:hypothetical protein